MAVNDIDVLIIGAGVVGLAVAAELARRPGCNPVLMERHERFGMETSSRNSEVIHAGIYYPSGSLKAKLCVEGNGMLYRFCQEHGVPFRRSGKLIVANSDAEILALERLYKQGLENGVSDLRLLDSRQAASLEPHVRAKAALLSPSTGVINSHRLMARLEEKALQEGALLAYRHTVTGMEPIGASYRVFFRNPDGGADSLICRRLVNCAGLAADRVAAMAGIDIDAAGYRIYPCKGEYFSLPPAKAKLVDRLIYPPPLEELQGLGVHLTKALDGRARLGPNALYLEEEKEDYDYTVNPAHAAAFYRAAKPFLPFLDQADLEPEMAGIRPKLQGPGQPFRDFVIRHEADRGLPGLVNLVGIESPGLTCCLAAARLVSSLLC